MASSASEGVFVTIIAEELSSGIERALNYWLGRIELEVVDRSLTTSQRIAAIEGILSEYKAGSGTAIRCLSA